MPNVFAIVGSMDLVIVAAIAFLLFGSRLPAVMKSLGQGIREFKNGFGDNDRGGDHDSH